MHLGRWRGWLQGTTDRVSSIPAPRCLMHAPPEQRRMAQPTRPPPPAPSCVQCNPANVRQWLRDKCSGPVAMAASLPDKWVGRTSGSHYACLACSVWHTPASPKHVYTFLPLLFPCLIRCCLLLLIPSSPLAYLVTCNTHIYAHSEGPQLAGAGVCACGVDPPLPARRTSAHPFLVT